MPVKKTLEILVVDGNPEETSRLVQAFGQAGIERGIKCLENGNDALMYVRRQGKYAGVNPPDMIFLDLSSPRVSGLEILKEIKATPRLMHIPVVVASGSDDPELVRAVYALNGNCFMRKPSESAQFLKFVETCYEFWGKMVTLSPQKEDTSAASHPPV